MKISTHRFSLVVAIALVSLLGVSIAPSNTQAQGEPTRVVVLNVPGGGTKALIDTITQIENVQIERQGWFLEQIQSRGFQAKGIMKRSDDIKWLMKGANVHYILYLAASGETAYEVRIVGRKTGAQVHAFAVDRTPSGLSNAGARSTGQQFSEFLAKQRRPTGQAAQANNTQTKVAQIDDGPADPNATKQAAANSDKAAKEKFSTGWLLASLRGTALRRDLHVAGTNEAVLSYTSVFYPGFALGIEAFPIGMSNPEYASVGFYGDLTQGFDSVTVPDDQGQDAAVSISHTEVEAGVMYLLGDALALADSNEAKFHMTVGVRHGTFGAGENASLPSVSHTSLVVGSRVSRKAFADNFKIRAGAEIAPIGVYGAGEILFGESSHTYGFGADLGGLFEATPEIGIMLGYEVRLQRTLFTGDGEADFVDANAFELVQGLTGGLFYQY